MKGHHVPSVCGRAIDANVRVGLEIAASVRVGLGMAASTMLDNELANGKRC